MQSTVGGGRSGVQRKEEGKHQPASLQEEDTAFSLGYPSCIRPALSRPLSVNLSVGPKNFTPFLPMAFRDEEPDLQAARCYP